MPTCRRRSPQHGVCGHQALSGSLFCSLHTCPLCLEEKRSSAKTCDACPKHQPQKDVQPAESAPVESAWVRARGTPREEGVRVFVTEWDLWLGHRGGGVRPSA